METGDGRYCSSEILFLKDNILYDQARGSVCINYKIMVLDNHKKYFPMTSHLMVEN